MSNVRHAHRRHKAYFAFLAHRCSGIVLALFLPFHFLLLGAAFDGAQGLDRYLVYTDLALVKIAEWGLVVCLSVHLLFGARVLVLEFTRSSDPSDHRLGWVIPGFVVALLVGVVFLIQVM